MSNETEVVKVLREAKEFLAADRSRWTQEAYARDAEGVDIGLQQAIEGHGVCFCAGGAIAHVARDRRLWSGGLFALEQVHYDMFDFNDSHTYEEVLAAFDAAIMKMERL